MITDPVVGPPCRNPKGAVLKGDLGKKTGGPANVKTGHSPEHCLVLTKVDSAIYSPDQLIEI
jgi:hypothetical protein